MDLFMLAKQRAFDPGLERLPIRATNWRNPRSVGGNGIGKKWPPGRRP